MPASWESPDEDNARGQFHSMSQALGSPITNMPDDVRDAIRWAEAEKKKRRMS